MSIPSSIITVNNRDTIVAIATATGPAGVGIIRVSGPDAFAISNPLVRKNVAKQASHTLRRATIQDPLTNEVLDDGLIAVFHAPKTFTGEDIVEFQGHGGSLVLTRVLEAFVQAGARLARPGEFSERAFLNGKLDLIQAEAIADLVTAQSVTAGRAARRHLSGALTQAVEMIAFAIKNALARIEASIDFPEDVGEIDPIIVGGFLESALAQTQKLLQTARYGRSLTEGITVAIIGRPNVGKSSILNYLAGSERAIVSDIPGTTRDVVSESLILGGVPVRILDTAGIRETHDPIEKIGVERSQNALKEADLVLLVRDASSINHISDVSDISDIDKISDIGKISEEEAFLASLPPTLSYLTLWNKSDLCLPNAQSKSREGIAVSCKTGEGFDSLHQAVAQRLGSSLELNDSDVLVTRARQENALREAERHLLEALESLHADLPPEIIAVDTHASIQKLGEITGVTTRRK